MNDTRNELHGVLPLAKARGVTSTKALAQAKRALGAKKAGHGGTLDPLADGVLILLFGDATRYARYALASGKEYEATMRFGYTSNTDDADGDITPGSPPPNEEQLAEELAQCLPKFCGVIRQVAPRHSALKYRGKPMYFYARKGIDAPAKTRAREIRRLTLQAARADTAVIDVVCESGTYIRSLARDIGAALGYGAYLTALTRRASGSHALQDAVSIDEIINSAEPRQYLRPIETLVKHLPALTADDGQIKKMANGIDVDINADNDTLPDNADNADNADNTDNADVRVYAPSGAFAGLAARRAGGYHAVNFLSWTRAV